MPPKVSVVIPTYNRNDYVQHAIDSVLASTYTDYEIIVVDDGSTDGTGEVLQLRYGDRIKYAWQENQGESAARNRGIQMARGEFIAFLDSDDLWLPEKLERQMTFARDHPHADWISCGWRVTDSSGTTTLKERRAWEEPAYCDAALHLLGFPSIPSVTLLRRACLVQIGGFDTDLRYGEDHDLWLRLLDAGHRIAFVEEILAEFRVHESNQSQDGSFVECEGGIRPVFEKFFARRATTSDDEHMQNAVYARAHLRRSCFRFARDEVPRALDDVKRALTLDPTLCEGGGEAALDVLLGFAHAHCVDNPVAYTRLVLGSLPEQCFTITGRWNKLMGRAAAGAYFRAARREEWHAVKAASLAILRYDWSWLRSRGFWSILARSLTGIAAGEARKAVRRIQRAVGQPNQ